MELTLSRLRTIVEKDFLIQPRLFDSVYQRKNRLNQTLTSGHFTYGSFRWIESHIEISNIFYSFQLYFIISPVGALSPVWSPLTSRTRSGCTWSERGATWRSTPTPCSPGETRTRWSYHATLQPLLSGSATECSLTLMREEETGAGLSSDTTSWQWRRGPQAGCQTFS